jgi:hypothetical protein
LYAFCGLNVKSDIAIPELPQSDLERRDVLITLKNDREQFIEPIWIHHWYSTGGKVIISYGRDDLYHWLSFPELSIFRISANTKEITVCPFPRTPEEIIRHLIIDQVLPRCLAHRGRIMLHASAVRLDKGLILFLGDSGTGKSTLAGDFYQAGKQILSDDCLWIKDNKETIKAIPTYGNLRLWKDSLENLFPDNQKRDDKGQDFIKKRIILEQGIPSISKQDLPVVSMFVLSPSIQKLVSEISLTRLTLRESFISIMKQSFQLNVMDVPRLKRRMKVLSRIVPRLPAYRLSMPHDYDLLPVVRKKVLEAVQ